MVEFDRRDFNDVFQQEYSNYTCLLYTSPCSWRRRARSVCDSRFSRRAMRMRSPQIFFFP